MFFTLNMFTLKMTCKMPAGSFFSKKFLAPNRKETTAGKYGAKKRDVVLASLFGR
jgi:hypothetical protein